MLQQIAPFVEAGFSIIPLLPRSKRPVEDKWTSNPTYTIDQLTHRYRVGMNVGVRLGEPSKIGDFFLYALDLDVRDPAEKEQVTTWLDTNFPDWKKHPIIRSGSGTGRHLYLLSEGKFASRKLAHSQNKVVGGDGKKHWSWEIEFFGTGKQVAFAGSIHPDSGKAYEWLRPWPFDAVALGAGPVIEPGTIVGWGAGADASKTASTKAVSADPFESGLRQRPKDFTKKQVANILKHLPADYTDDYETWLKVGMALHHQYEGGEDGLKAWHWFSKESDKYEPDVIELKWVSFHGKPNPVTFASLYQVARDAAGETPAEGTEEFEDDEPAAAEVERDLDLLGPPIEDDSDIDPGEAAAPKMPAFVREMNEKHAVADIKGKVIILKLVEDGTVNYLSGESFNMLYANRRIPDVVNGGTLAVSQAWLQHPKRTTYHGGVTFEPAGTPEGAFNLWRGWSVEPKKSASCALFIQHLREVICGGDEPSFEWLVRWLAHMVQKPWEKPGTALVLRSVKGTGKDTVGEYIGRLAPSHYVNLAQPEQLTGKFNAHLSQCLLLHAEETFWAANRSGEGVLKNLITAPQMQIEPKGVNSFPVKSCLRLMMSSNAEWVVPASGDERRYFVLDVSPCRKGDVPYFNALRDEMNGEGPAALLAYLQAVDLAGFNVRQPPMTQGLANQKVATLRNLELWWFETLRSGAIPISDFEGDDWETGVVRVDCDALRDDYKKWMKDRRWDGEIATTQQFGVRLRLLCPAMDRGRLRAGNGDRARQYILPTLNQCRAEFIAAMKMPSVDWGDGDPDEDLLGPAV